MITGCPLAKIVREHWGTSFITHKSWRVHSVPTHPAARSQIECADPGALPCLGSEVGVSRVLQVLSLLANLSNKSWN